MSGAAQMLTVRVPLEVRKRGGRKLVITPSGTINRGTAGADSTLIKALARAFRWRRMLEIGQYGTIDELAAAEGINGSYVCRILRLTLLAPDSVDAVLNGLQLPGITLAGLMEPFPVDWERQQPVTCLIRHGSPPGSEPHCASVTPEAMEQWDRRVLQNQTRMMPSPGRREHRTRT